MVKLINNKYSEKQKKLKIWNIVLICIILFGIIGAFTDDNEDKSSTKQSSNMKLKDNTTPTCDGISIIKNCELDGKRYNLYKYYPAIEEQSHIEKVRKYKKEITGYCTLCNDGTYSPTCATGSGASSHHGGVAQWNAPLYSQVPYYEETKVIDVPAVTERYEIIEK